MNETFKRYLISSVVTFFAAFAIVMVANIDDITPKNIGTEATFALIFTAVRAGIKALLESFLLWYNNR